MLKNKYHEVQLFCCTKIKYKVKHYWHFNWRINI